MAKEAIVMQLNDFLKEYGQKEIEIAMRAKDAKFNEFQKIFIQNGNAQEEIKKAATILKNNVQLNKLNKSVEISGKLAKFNAFVGVVDLCVDVAGFAIIYHKINEMEDKLNEVKDTIKETHELDIFYKKDSILSEYNEMLDHKKTGIDYGEDKYRKLIDDECNILKLFIECFEKDACINKEEVLYTITVLSAMLSSTMCDFDKIYYFNHKEKSKQHTSHEKWISIYEKLTNDKFINTMQDFMFIEKNYNQYETDLFTISITDEFKKAKQYILDNDEIIEMLDSKEKLDKFQSLIKNETVKEIKQAYSNMGFDNNKIIQNQINETLTQMRLQTQ